MTGRNAHIVGIAATQCERTSPATPRQLSASAVEGALADAGLSAGDIDAVYVANALAGLLTGQECIRGEVFLQGTPLVGLPIFNIENACASGSSALHLGCQAVSSG